MNAPSPKASQMLIILKQSVEKALDRKKRLGQYAVIWQDGKPVLVGDDAPPKSENTFRTSPVD